MEESTRVIYQSPIGQILIEYSDKGIQKLIFSDDKGTPSLGTPSLFKDQLDEYFNRERESFDLPLDLQGTEFQKRVWAELVKIPFGKTMTYKELSIKLGNLKAIRAVGAANGANPVSIIVPCHRVIGSDGSLTGYAGGLWRKQWLLNFESDRRSLF